MRAGSIPTDVSDPRPGREAGRPRVAPSHRPVFSPSNAHSRPHSSVGTASRAGPHPDYSPQGFPAAKVVPNVGMALIAAGGECSLAELFRPQEALRGEGRVALITSD